MEEYTVKIDNEGNIQWLQNGRYHRIGGPAVEYTDGYKAWYREGKLHRLDGPAIEGANGVEEWHIDGKEYSQDEFNEVINPKVKELTVEEISSLLGYKIKIVG